VPLIAVAYAAFAAGLLCGFANIAWLPIAMGFPALIIGAIRRKTVIAGVALFCMAGAMTASAAAPAQRAGHMKQQAEGGPLARMKSRASKSIDRLFGGDAPMAKALLIAEQQEIPLEMRDRYARAGMVHMLSISGLHVAIIAGTILLVLQAARVPRDAATIAGIILTGFYVAIIGAPPPAVRSAAMLAIVGASRLTQRPTSQWAALAVGAFAPLINPRTMLDLGYQLSVLGIAGLIASGKLSRRILGNRKVRHKKIYKELIASFVATIITTPLVAWYFGRISLIAPFSNLIAGPIVSILQPCLFLALAFAPIPAIGRMFADASHPLLAAFDRIAVIASVMPAASIDVTPSLVTVVIGGLIVICLITACMSRYPARPAIASLAGVCLIVWSPGLHLPYAGGVEMHVLDVGQGDAILIRTDRGRWIIFDAGRIWRTGDAGKSKVMPYIRTRGGSVEAFVLSHAHADHIGGAASVIRAIKPHYFFDAAFAQGSSVYSNTLRVADSAGTEWTRVHPGAELNVDGVVMRFLAPDSAWTASLNDPNEASTIAVVEYGDVRFLLTGDAERDEEKWLLDHELGELHADVLKVAHHGSSTSSTDAFLRAVQPALAVISVGADNRYGHPSPDVIASLARTGAQTVRTDKVGTIIVRTDGKRLTYQAGGETWDISRR
jgi:competence protein ComEC